MKRILVQFNIPGMTSKQYDQAWEQLREKGFSHPNGLVHHIGAQQGNNWVVVDVWESLEQFEKFGETLGPILGSVGVTKVEPTVTPVHYEVGPTPATAR
jgi:hypothetical protein